MRAMKQLLPVAAGLLTAIVLSAACDDSNSIPGSSGGSGGSAACSEPAKNEFCRSCTFSENATPKTCETPRTVNACCAWVQAPSQELARGTGLQRYSSDDP